MRDPKRISRILEVIKTIWEKNPDLRLGQLLLNCHYPHCDDLYYVEDEQLEKTIKEVYDGRPEKRT